jgi:hypothetical protein
MVRLILRYMSLYWPQPHPPTPTSLSLSSLSSLLSLSGRGAQWTGLSPPPSPQREKREIISMIAVANFAMVLQWFSMILQWFYRLWTLWTSSCPRASSTPLWGPPLTVTGDATGRCEPLYRPCNGQTAREFWKWERRKEFWEWDSIRDRTAVIHVLKACRILE